MCIKRSYAVPYIKREAFEAHFIYSNRTVKKLFIEVSSPFGVERKISIITKLFEVFTIIVFLLYIFLNLLSAVFLNFIIS